MTATDRFLEPNHSPTDSMIHILKTIVSVLDLNEQELLETAGLPGDFLRSANDDVSPSQILAADIAIEKVSGRDDLAYYLAMFRARTPRPHSTLAFSQCATVEDGIETLAMGRSADDYTIITVSRRDDCVRVALKPRSEDVVLLHWVLLCEILYILELCRTYTARPIVPRAVGIAGADRVRPDDIAFLGVAPCETEHAFIDFEFEDAGQRLLTAHSPLAGTAGTQTPDEAAVPMPGRAMRAVSDTLQQILPSGRFSIEDVGQRLNINVRKLQRQLKAEGGSFRSVLDDTRKMLAVRYLQDEQRPVAEVAYLLGYRDQNSFYRAFKSWTGTTTRSLREPG